jgi:prefoldin subunit 5
MVNLLSQIENTLDRVAKEQELFAIEIRQLAASQERTNKAIERTEKSIDKLIKSQERTDESIDKLIKSQERTDESIDKLIKSQERTDESIDKLGKAISKLAKEIGGGLRRVAESLTEASIHKLFKQQGIIIKEVQQRVKVYDGKHNVLAEIDLICPARFNGKTVVLVGEIKANLSITDINDFLKTLGKFKQYFPQYKSVMIFALVSGVSVAPNVAKFAIKSGLYVLSPSGETMRLRNPPKFRAKQW